MVNLHVLHREGSWVTFLQWRNSWRKLSRRLSGVWRMERLSIDGLKHSARILRELTRIFFCRPDSVGPEPPEFHCSESVVVELLPNADADSLDPSDYEENFDYFRVLSSRKSPMRNCLCLGNWMGFCLISLLGGSERGKDTLALPPPSRDLDYSRNDR